jgi:hypothetical protein
MSNSIQLDWLRAFFVFVSIKPTKEGKNQHHCPWKSGSKEVYEACLSIPIGQDPFSKLVGCM